MSEINEQMKDFKEQVEAIPIPEEKLDTATQSALQTNSQNKKGRKILKQVAIAASLFIMFIAGISFAQSDLQNIFGSLFPSEKEIDQDQTSEIEIHKTIKDKETEIHFKELMFDEKNFELEFEIPVGHLVDFEDDQVPFGIPYHWVDYQAYINGKPMSGLLEIRGLLSRDNEVLTGTFTSDSRFPDKFNFKLQINEIVDLKGNWTLELPLRKRGPSYKYEVKQQLNTQDLTAKITKLIETPSEILIQLEVETKNGLNHKKIDFLFADKETQQSLSMKDAHTRWEDDKPKSQFEITLDKHKSVSHIVMQAIKGNRHQEYTPIEGAKLVIPLKNGEKVEPIDWEIFNRIHKFRPPNEETFLKDKMIEEFFKAYGLRGYRYMRWHGALVSNKINSDIYKSGLLEGNSVEPIGVINYNNEGFVLFKEENGTTHVWKVRRDNDQWTVTEKNSFTGMKVDKLQEQYIETYKLVLSKLMGSGKLKVTMTK